MGHTLKREETMRGEYHESYWSNVSRITTMTQSGRQKNTSSGFGREDVCKRKGPEIVTGVA